MVIPPPVRPPRVTEFLKPYVLKMHFTNKFVHAQVIHSPTASVAASASSQEKALRSSMGITRDVAAAAKIGKILGERLLMKNIPAVSIFLKREQKYHGKVKAVIDSMRDAVWNARDSSTELPSVNCAMGLLEKLWDDTVAGPRPENGLGKLRKYNTFSFRPSSGKDLDGGNPRSLGDEATEEETRVTRRIMIMKPSGHNFQNGSPPVSPAGSSAPTSPFSGSRGSFRFRRGSRDAHEKASEAGIGSPSSPEDIQHMNSGSLIHG
ncbi:hypothetical protein Ancab_000707 [Ancistrocladus abbreviatus]